MRIARRWEAAQLEAALPHTRRVALRAAMVMSPDRGGVFDVLLGMARLGLGGPVAGGGQYVSWIHDHDFVRAVELLLDRDDLDGPVNLAAPQPLPQRDLMRGCAGLGPRSGCRPRRGWPRSGPGRCAPTPSSLLKSRRVVPGRLLDAGFAFEHPQWPEAAEDLVSRVRSRTKASRT